MTILLTTDMSEGAATALNYASVQPEAKDGLIVAHVVDSLGPELWAILIETPGELGDQIAEERKSELSAWTFNSFMDEDVDLDISFRVTFGKVHEEVEALAQELKPDRIVCGAVGKGQSVFHSVGTTALRIAASGSVPVTVIRSSNSLHPQVFLVPYDFTPRSDAALDYAHARAKKIGAKLHILNAVPAATVPVVSQQLLVMRDDVTKSRKKRLAERIEGFEVEVEVEFSYEPPHLAIVEASHRLLESEIVISSHGRSKLGRIALGSVAERVLREVDRPVTLVPFHE